MCFFGCGVGDVFGGGGGVGVAWPKLECHLDSPYWYESNYYLSTPTIMLVSQQILKHYV